MVDFNSPRIKISTRIEVLTTFISWIRKKNETKCCTFWPTLKFKTNCKLFTLTLRLCWMNYLLKRPWPFLYWCGVPYLQFRWFLTFEHGAFFVQTSHTFREKATFEDFTIKPTSEGIKEAKLSSLFVLTLEQLAAATTFGLGTKYHVSFFSHAKKKTDCVLQ